MSKIIAKKVCMLILDGWGFSDNWAGNAISLANPKNFNHLWDLFGHKILDTHDKTKPADINKLKSEVCHTTISAGHFVDTLSAGISQCINDQSISSNKAINNAFDFSKTNDSVLHLISPLDETEQSIDNIKYILKIAESCHTREIYIHLIIHCDDGVKNKLIKVREIIEKYHNAKVVSIMGSKYITLSNEYENIIRGYKAITHGEGKGYLDFDQAISHIENSKNDHKNLEPMILIEGGNAIGKLADFDVVIFMYTSPDVIKVFFSYFTEDINIRKLGKRFNINLVAFSDYLLGLSAKYLVAFEPEKILPNIVSVISEENLTQVHISDSSKIENVGYYFDGRSKQKFPGEQIMTITEGSSFGKTETEMSAMHIAKIVVDQIMSNKTNFILANFANADFFAHTGDIKQTARAVFSVDQALRTIAGVSLNTGADLIITGDHGNAESMALTSKNSSIKEHSTSPVPFILVSEKTRKSNEFSNKYHFRKSDLLIKHGSVIDIAPTVLDLFGIEKPEEFVGQSLLAQLD